MSRKGDPTKSVYLIFFPGGISTINYRTLYQESESNKAFIVETNKITKAVLEIPQETCPPSCRVEVPSACQSV